MLKLRCHQTLTLSLIHPICPQLYMPAPAHTCLCLCPGHAVPPHIPMPLSKAPNPMHAHVLICACLHSPHDLVPLNCLLHHSCQTSGSSRLLNLEPIKL